ncbi:MAG: hypothetical protein Q9219_002523 [cf. Caloplaca sp. 3 TL-2023]
MSIVDETRYSHDGYQTVIVASVLIFMLFLMVFGRFYSRRMQKVMLEVDDLVLLLATLLNFALCAIGITFPRIARAGTGLDPASEVSLDDARVVQASYIAWIALYGASVALSKYAILLLFLRVFTTSNKSFAWATYTISFFVGALGVATIVGSIFQCTPIARNWDISRAGTCINKLDFARYAAVPNVITGFAMLILPLPMVWRLNVTIQQKIALTATFLHGIIGFAASIARLVILFEPAEMRSTNSLAISWTIWTMVEPANYVIAACLPTLRPILVKILPPSFFLLTYRRRSKPYTSLKISWPKGRSTPKITLASADIHSPSHLTGPWDASRKTCNDLEANDATCQEKVQKDVTQSTREVIPTPPALL